MIDKHSEKHYKYKTYYKPNILYWGLGIENEVYLELSLSNSRLIPKSDIINKQKRERYSVDYYKNYKPEYIKRALENYISNIDGDTIIVPCLLNANSFTKTDQYNQPTRLYTKLCEENPKFSGETFIETLQNKNPYFKNTIDNDWLFDGDTIEFNTLNFFNTTLNVVIDELEFNKNRFIHEINNTLSNIDSSYYKNHSVSIMKQNYAFAKYMTNVNNVSMFNNGTLHYNITLPTQLNNDGKILDWSQFLKDHRKAIRVVQWMEPFIITTYCSPDPFSNIVEGFSKTSQRLAVSRYIGIGTYNSDIMEPGKILSKPITDIVSNKYAEWWYPKFIDSSAYCKLESIGMDINFNKHYNHGIELRFLDHIVEISKLKECFEFIIYLMDFILETDNIDNYGNPILNSNWNNIVLNIMLYGKDYCLTQQEKELYEQIFLFTPLHIENAQSASHCSLINAPDGGVLNVQRCTLVGNTVGEIYDEMHKIFIERYKNGGLFSKYTIERNISIPEKQMHNRVRNKYEFDIKNCCLIA